MSPTPMEKMSEPDLAYLPIPKSRYASAAFAALEWERMWTQVWLMAGRASDIPEPGDYFTFELGRELVLVVRQRDGSIAARYNVCMHRGNRLRDPGRGHAKEFRCLFHGWRYGIDGTLAQALDCIAPDHWSRLLELCDEAAERFGATLRPQVAARPNTLLIGHQTFSPFTFRPSYMQLLSLGFEEWITRLRDPELRANILAEGSTYPVPQLKVVLDMIANGLDKIFRLGDPPDYEPPPEQSVKLQAGALGMDPYELLYDWMLEMEGKQLLMLTLLNYSGRDLEPVRAILEHPRTAFGLGDGGAHCGAICDASMPTSLLAQWARDRVRGPKLPLGVSRSQNSAMTCPLALDA